MNSIKKDSSHINNGKNANSFSEFCWIFFPLLIPLELIVIFVILPPLTPEVSPDYASLYVMKRFIGACLPEPLEHNRYISSVILLFLFFLTLGHFSPQIILKAKKTNLNSTLKLVFIILSQLSIVVFLIFNWIHQIDSKYIYFDKPWFIYFISLCVFFIFFYFNFENIFNKITNLKSIKVIAIGIAIALIILGLLPSIFTDFNIRYASTTIQYHLPFTMEEFSSVYFGHTPLVNYFPQYQNLFPIIFSPFFKVFGLSITTFTFLMTSLSALGLLFTLLILIRFTKESVSACLLFIVFLTASFYPVSPYLDGPLERNYFFNYFAFSPLRTFGTWLVFLLFTNYILQRSRMNLIILFVTASLILINNVEFGIASLVAASIGTLLSEENKLVPSFKTISKILLTISLSFIFSLILYSLIIYLRSGDFPDFNSFLSYQLVFAKLGFDMLPMPILGIHFFIFLTFGAAVAFSILCLAVPQSVERKIRLAIILFSGVMGFGTSVYFVGRSHELVLPSLFSYWMFTLCLLFGDISLIWRNSISKLCFKFKLIYIIPTKTIIFMFCIFIPHTFDYVPLASQIERFTSRDNELRNAQESFSQYIKLHNQEKHSLMVIFPYGHQISHGAGFYNEFPFANQTSLLLKSHALKVVSIINKKNIRKIFGNIPYEIQNELIKLDFHHKESFKVHSGMLSVVGMDVFSFWER